MIEAGTMPSARTGDDRLPIAPPGPVRDRVERRFAANG
jgi:hypothetical protein